LNLISYFVAQEAVPEAASEIHQSALAFTILNNSASSADFISLIFMPFYQIIYKRTEQSLVQ